jgi:hypothetical protein
MDGLHKNGFPSISLVAALAQLEFCDKLKCDNAWVDDGASAEPLTRSLGGGMGGGWAH